MSERNWKITGYDGAKVLFERFVTEGALSEKQMMELLLRLQAKHLTNEEIISSSLKKRSKGRTDHLEVRRNSRGKYALMTTGSGWHYAATLIPDGAA